MFSFYKLKCSINVEQYFVSELVLGISVTLLTGWFLSSEY